MHTLKITGYNFFSIRKLVQREFIHIVFTIKPLASVLNLSLTVLTTLTNLSTLIGFYITSLRINKKNIIIYFA